MPDRPAPTIRTSTCSVRPVRAGAVARRVGRRRQVRRSCVGARHRSVIRTRAATLSTLCRLRQRDVDHTSTACISVGHGRPSTPPQRPVRRAAGAHAGPPATTASARSSRRPSGCSPSGRCTRSPSTTSRAARASPGRRSTSTSPRRTPSCSTLLDRVVEEARGVARRRRSSAPPRTRRAGCARRITAIYETFRAHRAVTLAGADAGVDEPRGPASCGRA